MEGEHVLHTRVPDTGDAPAANTGIARRLKEADLHLLSHVSHEAACQ